MTSKAIVSPEPTKLVCYGEEKSDFHTRLLRTSLCLEESRAYWEHYRDDIPKNKLPTVAFEERWFGSKSMARVRSLLVELNYRFESYPVARSLLRYWCPSDPVTRQNICHWHMQLTDPLYRNFTGVFLEQRRQQTNANIERNTVARWVTEQIKSDWSSATTLRMATSLIGVCAAAGLCTENTGTRQLQYPKVSDEALVYWLYFLRHVKFTGSLLDNPYFTSIGLSGSFLEQRLRRLSGIAFSRMGELVDFGWDYPDLKTCAIQVLGVKWEDK
jgi:Putative inner membrane protein (DUF1819)